MERPDQLELIGICKIQFRYLWFNNQPDDDRITDLLCDFKLRGCQRDWKENFINIVLEDAEIEQLFEPDKSWRFEGANTLAMKSAVANHVRHLNAIDGCQRVNAAKIFYKRRRNTRTELWWTANIYRRGM